MKDPGKERQYDHWHKDPSNWRGGVFYFNTKDPRMLVPKRNPSLGWTLNFGNTWSYLIFALVIMLIYIIVKYS